MLRTERELAEVKAKLTPLERANKPPEPFKPEPYQRYDPTANMSMPPSVLQEMANAVPDHVMRGIVHDNQAPQGRPGVIPTSQQQVSGVRPGGNCPPGGGSGWGREIPLGPSMHQRYVEVQFDAQDAKDRRELIEQKEREQAFLKAAERTP